MAKDLILEDVRDIVNKSINSIAHLEALLLRGNSDERWTADSAARRLYISRATLSVAPKRTPISNARLRASQSSVFFYLARLVTFGLILDAIIDKNRSGERRG